MNYSKMTALSYKTGVLLMVLSLMLGCAHKKAYKRALELEKSGQYVAAAEQDLKALDKKPEFEDAHAHLSIIAPKAYEELRSTAENSERNNQWVAAINHWKHLDILLGRFLRHNIHLSTIDVKTRMTRAREMGTNFYYAAGEQAFNRGQYPIAIDHFKNVQTISGKYRDSEKKLWLSHVKLGDQKQVQGDFANAVEYYQDALHYTSDPSSTLPLIAESYYRWGSKFYQQKNYREATEKFEAVLSTVPNYRDAQSKRNDAYQKAVRRVAILPFKNSTPKADRKYADILTDNLLNCCIGAQLKYATFINRTNLDMILEEHKLAMSGVVDPTKANQMGKLEGIHYFIIGTITQIVPRKNPPTYQDLTYNKPYSVKDSAGNVIQQTTAINYREYTNQHSVKLTASIQIVEVETGRYVSGNTFEEDVVDEFQWVKYSGNIADLPEDKKSMVNKRPAFRSEDVMISEGLDRMTKKMGDNILAYFK